MGEVDYPNKSVGRSSKAHLRAYIIMFAQILLQKSMESHHNLPDSRSLGSRRPQRHEKTTCNLGLYIPDRWAASYGPSFQPCSLDFQNTVVVFHLPPKFSSLTLPSEAFALCGRAKSKPKGGFRSQLTFSGC